MKNQNSKQEANRNLKIETVGRSASSQMKMNLLQGLCRYKQQLKSTALMSWQILFQPSFLLPSVYVEADSVFSVA